MTDFLMTARQRIGPYLRSTDKDTPMNRFRPLCLPLLLFFIAFQVNAQVVINEWSAANYSQDTDNFGDNEDWVELYNTGAAAFDLSGYFLSDRLDNPMKWAFPAGTSLAAGDHILVWCSGRDTDGGGNYHTNFKLTQTKTTEAVVFSQPDGTLVESFNIFIPNQKNDAWARISDGDATWGVAENPTPGNSNTNVKEVYASAPEMDQTAGWYSGSVNVSISSPDAAVNIHYTTDGSDPNAGSPVYSGPINITSNTVLRAIAISSDSNIPNSHITTNSYFTEAPHDLKVLSVSGGEGVRELIEDGSWGAEPEGHLEYFMEDGTKRCDVTGEYNKHGNDSWAYPQRGFDFIARDQFGINHAVQDSIFEEKDRKKFQRIIVKAGANDNYPFEDGAYIRDAYLHKLSHEADMKMDERTYEPCVVYLNGEYWGLYEIREKVDDGDFTRYYYNQSKDEIDFIKTWGGTWAEYGDQTEWNALYNYMLSNDLSVAANYEYVKGELNVTSLVDYMLLNTHAVCMDWLNFNTAWWRGYNPDGDKKKWRYVLWDLDASFGHYVNYTGIPDTSPNGDPCFNEPGSVSDPEGHTEMLEALLANEEFNALYINRYADMNNTYFSCDYMIGLLDEMIDRIEPEMSRQTARWGGSVPGWQGRVQDLRDFILTRCTIIDEGIEDCYEVEGPYLLNVDVNPGEGGKVEINTFTPEDYFWSGEYFGGINITLTAQPDEGFVFSHWEVATSDGANNTYTDATITFEMAGTTNAIAYFVPVGLTIVLQVEPAGAGEIDANGTLYSSFPSSVFYQPADNVALTAIPGANAVFDRWELQNHTASPSDTDPAISFSGEFNDTITAFFNIEYSITILSDNPDGGDVYLGGFQIALPFVDDFAAGDPINLGALANEGFLFDSWEFLNNTPSPDANSNEISFEVNAGDTIIVHWIEQPSFTINSTDTEGTISVDGTELVDDFTVFVTAGETFDLSVSENDGFTFVGWFDADGNLVSSDPNFTYTATGADAITANFEVASYDITIILSSENGAINIDGTPVVDSLTMTVSHGQILNLEAIAPEGFDFDGWVSSFVIDPDNAASNATITVFEGGTITASFTEVADVCKPRYPLAFSPNGDQRNDIFRARYIDCTIENFSMKVINRWGQELFHSKDPGFEWFGLTPSGDLAPVGVYLVVFEYNYQNEDGVMEAQVDSGSLTLIR